MGLVSRLEALRNRRFTDEDGHDYELKLLAPMSDAEIEAFAKRLPCPIPPDIRAALKVTRGFENGPLETVEFASMRDADFGLEEIFPAALEIAHDGYGNFWVADLLPSSTTIGPVYFACHDAPVIVYQCANLSEFVDAYVEMCETHKGPLDFVHEQATSQIWRSEPGLMEHSAALASADPELKAFAQTLRETWKFTDLRNAKTGDGFAWGKAESPDHIRRWKTLPIWAYERKVPLLKRLFGR